MKVLITGGTGTVGKALIQQNDNLLWFSNNLFLTGFTKLLFK